MYVFTKQKKKKQQKMVSQLMQVVEKCRTPIDLFLTSIIDFWKSKNRPIDNRTDDSKN